jgi:hypothetical protein
MHSKLFKSHSFHPKQYSSFPSYILLFGNEYLEDPTFFSKILCVIFSMNVEIHVLLPLQDERQVW